MISMTSRPIYRFPPRQSLRCRTKSILLDSHVNRFLPGTQHVVQWCTVTQLCCIESTRHYWICSHCSNCAGSYPRLFLLSRIRLCSHHIGHLQKNLSNDSPLICWMICFPWMPCGHWWSIWVGCALSISIWCPLYAINNDFGMWGSPQT